MAANLLEGLGELLATQELAALDNSTRGGCLSDKAAREAVTRWAATSGLANQRKELVTALVLLWHDHLESAHAIAQNIDSADGAFVHGIMHRREPDYGNSKYWFRRVGAHPVLTSIGRRVQAFQPGTPKTEELKRRLLRSTAFAPEAFVDACQGAASGTEAEREFLKQVQRVEFQALLEHLASA